MKKLQHPREYGKPYPVMYAPEPDTTYVRNRFTGDWMPIYRKFERKETLDPELMDASNFPFPEESA